MKRKKTNKKLRGGLKSSPYGPKTKVANAKEEK
jgi:hypothetical protein